MPSLAPSASAAPLTGGLDAPLVAALWAAVRRRLDQGEPLITLEQYSGALAREYRRLRGRAPGSDERQALHAMAESVNTRYPATYVGQGVRNGVRRAFNRAVAGLGWDATTIELLGSRSIDRFCRRDAVRELLEEVNVAAEQVDAVACVQHSVDRLASAALEPPGAAPAGASLTAASLTESLAQRARAELGSAAIRQRLAGQERRRQQLRAAELRRVPRRLPALVAQGTLTPDEAASLRQLNQIDRRLRAGRIDAGEAEQLRQACLGPALREAIQRKVRDAVDGLVRYIQVFAALRAVGPGADPALAFLIRHRDLVLAPTPDPPRLAVALAEMEADDALRQSLLDLMEQRDPEVRMLELRQPPYLWLVSPGLEKPAEMDVESGFLAVLRGATAAQFADLLHAAEPAARRRTTGSVICLISLLDHIAQATPFRLELRAACVQAALRGLYRTGVPTLQARRQAEQLLSRGLPVLFRDVTEDELAAVRARRAGWIAAVETEVAGRGRGAMARPAAVAGRRPADAPVAGDARPLADLVLSETERNAGVVLTQVAAGTAAQPHYREALVMPDPDDPLRFVLARRDAATGGVVPYVNRGRKRYVISDGQDRWRLE